MGSTQVIARNSVWIGLDRGIGFLAALVGSVSVARVMGPETVGYYNYILWITSLTAAISSFGVPVATRKYVAEFLGKNDLRSAATVAAATLRFQAATGAVVGSAAVIAVFVMVPREHQIYAALAVLSIVPTLMMAVSGAAIAAAERYELNFRASAISSAVNLLGVGLSLTFRWDLVGLAASLFIGRTLDFVLRYWYFRTAFGPSGSGELPKQLRSRIIRFCINSVVLMAVNIVIWDRSEIFFLKWFGDIKQVAFYSLAFNITQQIIILPQVFASAASATMMVEYGRRPDSVRKMTANTLRYLALPTIPMLLGLAAMSSTVIRIVYGEKYLPVVPVLALSAVFSVPRSMLLPFQQLFVAIEKQSTVVKWSIPCMVLNVALDVAWIRHGGSVGAAWANGIAQVVAAGGMWYLAMQACSVPIPWKLLSRVSVSALVMAVVVWNLCSSLPPLAAIILTPVVGAVVFLVLLRLTRALEIEDRTRLLGLAVNGPASVLKTYAFMIHLLVPADLQSELPLEISNAGN